MNAAALRPWTTTGIALVGTAVIALTPISIPPTLHSAPAIQAAVHAPVDLAAWPYVLSLPVLTQRIRNAIDYATILVSGLAQAGAGAWQSFVAIPETIVTITRQLLALDISGALNTFTTSVVDAIAAVGGPLLDAAIERRQKYLAVQSALQVAVPEALISVGSGFFSAASLVTQSFLAATEGVLNAILPINLGNLFNALVDGARLIVDGFVAGGAAAVAGIEGAQKTLVEALQAVPPPATMLVNSTAPGSTDLGLRTGARTLTLVVDNTVDQSDPDPAPVLEASAEEEKAPVETPVETPADDQPTGAPTEPTAEVIPDVDEVGDVDDADDVGEEAGDVEDAPSDEVEPTKADDPEPAPVEAAEPTHEAPAPAPAKEQPDTAPATEKAAA